MGRPRLETPVELFEEFCAEQTVRCGNRLTVADERIRGERRRLIDEGDDVPVRPLHPDTGYRWPIEEEEL